MTEQEAQQWIADNQAKKYSVNEDTDNEVFFVATNSFTLAKGSTLVEAVEACQALIVLEDRKDQYREKLVSVNLIV